MTLTSALKGLPRLPVSTEVKDSSSGESIRLAGLVDEDTGRLSKGVSIQGNVSITDADGNKVDLSAADLMDALSSEVNDLRNEMAKVRSEREVELRSNLLTYIQALPDKELARLTSDMSDEVMESIQLLVDALMSKLGVGVGGEEVVIQQSVGVLAQLCMWQMVVGYKLRELEAMEKGVDL